MFFANTKKTKSKVAKVKPKVKVNAVVEAEEIVTESEMQIIDSVVCDRCGNDMALAREYSGVKEYTCHNCGKKLSKN